MIVPSTFRGKKSAQHDGLVKIGHKNYFQLAKIPAGTVQKKKKERNKADNSFPINVTRPPFICPFDLLIVCTSRSFQFWSRSGHDHSLAFPTVHEIDIVVLRRFKFTRTVFPSTTPLPNPLSHPLVIRSAFTDIDCVYRFRCLSWSVVVPTKEKWKFGKSVGSRHEGRREIFEEKDGENSKFVSFR